MPPDRQPGGVRPAHRPEYGTATIAIGMDHHGAKKPGRNTFCADLVALFFPPVRHSSPPRYRAKSQSLAMQSACRATSSAATGPAGRYLAFG